ncbi:MAG TPA: UDP-N-acetylmuramoyl-L-alanine--D-glutamate ligase, partial [Elusimicrobia bacterium]|nr:UDP-N-acetylmuramoyl-L-alanine--D-glutamate ligase [Elusimicrobiota bacterium]
MVNAFGGKELSSSRVSILGAGRSGIACANLLHRLGAQVFLSEIKKKEEIENLNELNKNIDTEFGKHSEKILFSDLIIPSPGIHLDIPVIEKAKEKNIPLYSELEIAYCLIKPKLIVAITGTNGKSTTTALVGEFFRIAKEKTVVAGNIGYPLSEAVQEIDSQTVVVLEVSSYQLELVEKFHPQIAVILNITPDHLERHQSMKNYSRVKARIYENQTKKDCSIFNADDEYCRELARDCPSQVIFFSRQKKLDEGVFLDGKDIVVKLATNYYSLSPTLKIPGPHNLENALSAVAISISAGLSPEVIVKGLNSFNGLE